MKPKKSLGQCFLTNQRAAQRIALLLKPKPGDIILEIGGGRGELTRWLLQSGATIHVVELDRDLVPLLRQRFSQLANFNLIEGDILEVDPAGLVEPGTEIKLIGNIPYHLSGEIIEWTVYRRNLFPEAVFTVQRELGQRLAATPGGKQFGSLSVLLQSSFAVKREFDLRPGSFFPPPQVSSTVVHLRRLPEYPVEMAELPALQRLLRACFRWRRKQLGNILKAEYELSTATVTEMLAEAEIAASRRPEQLAVAEIVTLLRRLPCSDRGSG